MSLSQRNEYQTDAYQTYFDKVEKGIDLIDKELTVQPIMRNSQAEGLDNFIDDYQKYIKAKFATDRTIQLFGKNIT